MPPAKTLRQERKTKTAETNKKRKEEERSDPNNTPNNRHDYTNSESKTLNNDKTVLFLVNKTAGILEHISITKGNLDFLADDDAFKFVDDSSFIEILNLISIGMSSLNPKFQVPSDIPPEVGFLPSQNFATQNYLKTISDWTDTHLMKLNQTKTKYMIINFCTSLQFRTRLMLKDALLEQVHVTRLLGVLISDDLSWTENTKNLIKKANSRMTILRKLTEFEVPKSDMINIYILFIRSVIEQSSDVWSSSLTIEEKEGLERVQKIALRIIYQNNYKTYNNALELSKLPKIETRFQDLLLRFAIKCIKNDKTKDILPEVEQNNASRHPENTRSPWLGKTDSSIQLSQQWPEC